MGRPGAPTAAGAAARVPSEPPRGREPCQKVDERGGVRRAMRRVGGCHVGEMILEAPGRLHTVSSQVSETRCLPKLALRSLWTTRNPAAAYRRRAATSSLWVHSMILR